MPRRQAGSPRARQRQDESFEHNFLTMRQWPAPAPRDRHSRSRAVPAREACIRHIASIDELSIDTAPAPYRAPRKSPRPVRDFTTRTVVLRDTNPVRAARRAA